MMNKETGLPRSSKDKNWEACRVGLTDIPRGATEARKLKWNSALECGINAIDAQHRELFEVSNALLETIHKNPSESEAALKVEILINEVESHFRSEESLLAGWNHPLTEDHKAVHEDLLARANELLARAKNGTLSYRCALYFLVDDLVYGHIASEDREFLFPI